MIGVLALASIGGFAPPITVEDIRFCGQPYYKITVRANSSAPKQQLESSLLVAGKECHVVWESRKVSGPQTRIFATTFGPVGTMPSPERDLTSTYKTSLGKPLLMEGPQGVFAAFQAEYGDQSGGSVHVGERQLNMRFLGEQSDVVVASGHGRHLAVWSSDISATKRRLFARVLNADGTPIGPEFRLTDSISGSEVLPAVCSTGDGFVAVWQRFESNSAPAGVHVQRFDKGGERIGNSVSVGSRLAIEPVIGTTSEGLVIAWVEPNGHIGHRVAAAMYDRSLRQVATLPLPALGSSNAPAVASLDGRVVVAWNVRNGDDVDVRLRMFDKKGRQLEEHTVASGPGRQALSERTGRTQVAFEASGALCVAWSGIGPGSSDSDVFLTRIAPGSEMADEVITRLRLMEASYQAPITGSASVLEGSAGITSIAEVAGPHEPPTFNKRLREDPWGRGSYSGDGTGFLGIVSTGWTPPDPHVACGPNQLVAMTNGAIAFFDKDGTKTFQQAIENSFGFWGSLGATNFVFDPEVIFDPHSNRFMAMAAERAPNSRSFFLVAVSDDSDPNGTWFKYRIDVTALAGGDIDSPNIASDNNVVYLSADFFTGGQKYLIYMMRKSDLLTGGAPVTRSMLITGTQSHGLPVTYDSGAPAQYMIEHFEASSNTTVRLHAIQDPLGTPTRTTFSLSVPVYGPPEDPPSSGTSARPETFDSRFWSCVYRNGRLWATHHINSSRVLARWYEIDMNGWPTSGNSPILVQSGNIDPGAGIRTFFSSVSVDGSGNAAVLCSRSATNEFISIFGATRRSGDPLGSMPHTEIFKTSVGPFSGGRWGDYSAVVPDPADGRTFWGHHEWAENGAWRTWIHPFRPPVSDVTVNPSSFAVTHGVLQSGVLSDLFASDNLRVVIQQRSPATPVDPSVRMIVDGTSPTETPSALQFVLESSCSAVPSSAVRQRTFMFNYQSNTWELVDERTPSTTDTTVTVNITSNASRFVQPGTRLMRTRTDWYDLFVPTLNWGSQIDRAVWLVSP